MSNPASAFRFRLLIPSIARGIINSRFKKYEISSATISDTPVLTIIFSRGIAKIPGNNAMAATAISIDFFDVFFIVFVLTNSMFTDLRIGICYRNVVTGMFFYFLCRYSLRF